MNVDSITISDGLIIIASILGPVLAVQIQKWLEVWREKRNRKLWIFHNLMATRASRVAERHVEALNSIQLEYCSSAKGKAKCVKDSWAEYHAHLNRKGENEVEILQWLQKGDELFINLLHEMSQYLGYDYNRVDIQNGGYSPMAHGNRQALQDLIAQKFADLLSSKSAIRVKLDTESCDNATKKLS